MQYVIGNGRLMQPHLVQVAEAGPIPELLVDSAVGYHNRCQPNERHTPSTPETSDTALVVYFSDAVEERL